MTSTARPCMLLSRCNAHLGMRSQAADGVAMGGERFSVVEASALGVQVYRDDDTILSWDLINEPRCDRIGCDTDMLAWIEEMAPYVKALDSNHLLTVGELSKNTGRESRPCSVARVLQGGQRDVRRKCLI